jgi:Zn-dependent peptidase ImmA (M78 family)
VRRGFKTEADAIAREVRGELGLALASPLDVWRLAEHLEIPVIPLSSLRESAPLAGDLFLNGSQGMFSGLTVFRGNERTIVFNDAHVPGRQASDVGHELSHGLLLHPPMAAVDERGCRYWDGDVEDEANWLSGALLVPEEAALSVARRGWSLAVAAAHYGVTQKMMEFRINVTGAIKRVRRAAAKRRE